MGFVALGCHIPFQSCPALRQLKLETASGLAGWGMKSCAMTLLSLSPARPGTARHGTGQPGTARHGSSAQLHPRDARGTSQLAQPCRAPRAWAEPPARQSSLCGAHTTGTWHIWALDPLQLLGQSWALPAPPRSAHHSLPWHPVRRKINPKPLWVLLCISSCREINLAQSDVLLQDIWASMQKPVNL